MALYETKDVTKVSKEIIAGSSTIIDNEANISQNLVSVLLNEFNYLPWSRAVTIALGGRSRVGFINGKEKAPDADSPRYDTWLSKDQMVNYVMAS